MLGIERGRKASKCERILEYNRQYKGSIERIQHWPNWDIHVSVTSSTKTSHIMLSRVFCLAQEIKRESKLDMIKKVTESMFDCPNTR